jgi:curli biogenesis system outer membrane secretion channel CsgG
MKYFLVTLALIAAIAGTASAQNTPAGKKKIAITKITAGAALSTRMQQQGSGLSLQSVIESLDPQILDRIQSTKRFEVLERTDAGALAQEAAASGRVFAFNGADYVLTVSVDNFQDAVETRAFSGTGKSFTKRTIVLSAVAKISEVQTQKVLTTTNFEVTKSGVGENSKSTVAANGNTSDTLLTEATRDMSQRIADRVVDSIFPARIIGRRDKIVTINRNDTSPIAVGQTWEVFTLGQELTDPDTGEKSREEVLVGTIRVTRVTPQNSQAEVLEDNGVDVGAVIRPKQ